MIKTEWPNNLPRLGNTQQKKIKSNSDWFEIYELNPLTYALLEPNHWEEVISYLIIGNKKATLFDSGMGIGDIRLEVEALTDLPVMVINSHSHYDHIGGNHQFQEIWCYNHEFESARIQKGYSIAECRTYMNPGAYMNLPGDIDPDLFFVPGAKISHLLDNGEQIDLGGRELIAYSTPGETPGAMSLYDHKYKMLFCGDLLYPGTLWLHINESDWNKFLQSLDSLNQIMSDVKSICPAHNEVCLQTSFFHEFYSDIQMIQEHKIEGTFSDQGIQFDFKKFSIILPGNR